MIKDIKKSTLCVGFTGKFKKMIKEQDFTCYNIDKADSNKIVIQSDTRIGYILLDSGQVYLTSPRSGGSYFIHLKDVKLTDQLSAKELTELLIVTNTLTPANTAVLNSHFITYKGA